ncbi:hypothetical protein JJB98_22300 [Bradyrhizobium diazoefficiens]|nr:hypothetical protein [Bradyrhizobium diazoefficiens]QQO22467.1 hypothetical protein JJB98_22300 [Bradyrhizobium diazoefficiens]
MIDDCSATLRPVSWVPADANSLQPNPLDTTMRDDAHHANRTLTQIADL